MKKPDINALQDIMNAKGLSLDDLAEKTGIRPIILNERFQEKSEFRASEIYGIAEALELSDEQKAAIFFGTEIN
ncbi:MAG: helix-turn-helix transcriptional regulator [Parasporobacterium sp.]|nr:helix-turn-helix transcriptional regulator [Parasporobacterium sp.]MBR3642781.1 helix-turn-helix transcriptional regulator [Parasporobacterium sp.]